ncbi:HlyD family secretion protein [Collimonas silvisoli]|uniref:HlyD family secretion protein n=1 Tax=Collimonas silvisoli TaxID=2825884 RepID=UPI001E3A3864|nr:HlyD family efflux transporter periplasmic adaptor subunit [Collimonas silvisoli]
MTTPNQTPQDPSAAAAAAAPAAVAANGNGKRRSLLIGVTIALIIVLIAYGIWWFIYARHYEGTDDAYVGGNVVQLTPQVGGTVLAINTDDTELVQAGKPLVELDKADAKVALEQAEAQLAQTVRQVRTLFVNNGTLVSNVAARSSELERASSDLVRRQQLISTGAVSKEELDHAKVAEQGAKAALQAAREQLASNRVLTDRTTVEQHPTVQNAAAQVRNAYINLARTTLLAPTTGYVAKRSVQVGQRVAAGTPLLSIVPLNALWVDANFKEVQINNMRIGQPVTLKSDLYGSKIEYHGKVVGLAAGTGSAFALLPAQNASGNWIKIVQRIPVRISLDPKDLESHPLRIGVSMDVSVDIAQTEGTSLTAGTARTAPAYTTDVFDKSGQEADQRIASIIAANDNAAAAH